MYSENPLSLSGFFVAFFAIPKGYTKIVPFAIIIFFFFITCYLYNLGA